MIQPIQEWPAARRAMLALALAIAGLGIVLGSPVRAAVPSSAASQMPQDRVMGALAATFGTGSAVSSFGEEIVFRQQATIDGEVQRAEALLEYPGGIGPVATEVGVPVTGEPTTLEYRLLVADGGLLPNTRLTARFRLTGFDGTVTTGPPITVTYEDSRFDWQTQSGDPVRVHWYEGDDAVGRQALAIAEMALANAEEFLGVTERAPVDFFLYADEEAWSEAVGPGVHENSQGLADSTIRTLLAWTGPDGVRDPYVRVVIAHELTHLVFDTAARNPYHRWPNWLDEGVADYLAQGYSPEYRGRVREAVREGTLIPLDGLTGQFPTVYDRFVLAYAESVSAIDFLVREHGTEALSQLVNSFADGLSDDEAFEAAIGQTTEEFNAAWFAALGAELPTAHGPQPAPPGPLPADWTEAPEPGATEAPGPSDGPAATPGDGGSVDGGGTGSAGAAVLVIGLGAAGAAVGTGWIIARRRPPVGPPPAGSPPAGPPPA